MHRDQKLECIRCYCSPLRKKGGGKKEGFGDISAPLLVVGGRYSCLTGRLREEEDRETIREDEAVQLLISNIGEVWCVQRV